MVDTIVKRSREIDATMSKLSTKIRTLEVDLQKSKAIKPQTKESKLRSNKLEKELRGVSKERGKLWDEKQTLIGI